MCGSRGVVREGLFESERGVVREREGGGLRARGGWFESERGVV